jgi:hypothetical protein
MELNNMTELNKTKRDFTEDAKIIATKLLPESLVKNKKVFRKVTTTVKRLLSCSDDLDRLLEELALTYEDMEAKINAEMEQRMNLPAVVEQKG